ncbi:unnamed protein product [Amoebophrya sp. A120]|nr:unnamed protein product [Amoebophrya sp. A120]|eukprot:GSA120T00014348001.1
MSSLTSSTGAAPIELVDRVDRCREIVDSFFANQITEIAVDMEGVNHGRNGRLSVIQVFVDQKNGVEKKVYLFDITVMQSEAFEHGKLKQLFESKQILKVLFDIRGDADALWHLFKVKYDHAYDIQVLYTFKFQETSDGYLKGFAKVQDAFSGLSYADKLRLKKVKDEGVALFGDGKSEIWEKRPLPAALVNYCAADVEYLLRMKQAWDPTCAEKYTATVKSVTQSRRENFVGARIPVEGRNKAKRDV